MFNESQFLKALSTVLISSWIPVYLLADQNMLGSLYFTTEIIRVIAQTNSEHKTSKTTIAITKLIKKNPFTTLKVTAWRV